MFPPHQDAARRHRRAAGRRLDGSGPGTRLTMAVEADLSEVAGIRHPVWVTRDGGKWRAMLKRLEVNVPMEEALFARPR